MPPRIRGRRPHEGLDGNPKFKTKKGGHAGRGRGQQRSEAVIRRSVIVHYEIGRLAYSYWEARGFCGGSAEEDWYRAEEELKKTHNAG